MRIYLMHILFAIAVCFLLPSSSNKTTISPLPSKTDSLNFYFDVANQDALRREIRVKATQDALKIVNTLSNDSIRRENLLKVANRYWNIGDYPNHYSLVKFVLKEADYDNDIHSKALCYLFLQDHFQRQNVLDSAFTYILLSERLLTKINNQKKLASVFLRKAEFYYLQNNYFDSEKNLYLALRVNEVEIEDKFACNLKLALLNLKYKDFKTAKKHLDTANALAMKEPHNEFMNRAELYNDIGIYYFQSKKYIKAEESFLKALKEPNTRKYYPSVYAALLTNLALSKLQRDELTSPVLIEQALKIQDSGKYSEGIILSNSSLALFYLRNKDSIRALNKARNAYASAIKYKSHENILYTLRTLIKIDKKNSSIYTNKYLQLLDSIQILERRNQNKFARIEYETDQLEQQFEKIKHEKTRTSQVALVLLLLLLTILIIWYYYMRNKELRLIREKTEQNHQIAALLEVQERKFQQGKNIEKRRIARELHDGIMSRLSSTRLNLFALKKAPNANTIERCITHIDSILEIEKEIRLIAYNLDKEILSSHINFLSIIEGLFADMQEHLDIQLHLNSEDIRWKNISTNVKMQLYRILQECLANIEKHSFAKNIYLTITTDSKSIFIILKDDGIGFNRKEIKRGLGISNLYRRMRSIHAQVTLESKIGFGTTISISVPINNKTSNLKNGKSKHPDN